MTAVYTACYLNTASSIVHSITLGATHSQLSVNEQNASYEAKPPVWFVGVTVHPRTHCALGHEASVCQGPIRMIPLKQLSRMTTLPLVSENIERTPTLRLFLGATSGPCAPTHSACFGLGPSIRWEMDDIAEADHASWRI